MNFYLRSLTSFIFCFSNVFFSCAQQSGTELITVNIDLNKKAQIIDNIGSSGCWFSEGIGRDWPAEKKNKIADLLFTRKIDAKGNPEGIGLSAWRFNIGAGTLEQGDSSGIKDFRKRSDCFLSPDGSYDWSKQAGQRFFLQKAHDYGVETLIAFANSAPVQFTKNGLGYKTEKDYKANLRDDAYGAYAQFLATVVKHFNTQGLPIAYVSPVNEPQWDWSHKYLEGVQEGSPWNNENIYNITKALDLSLEKEKQKTRILVSEAGMLDYLYGGSGGTSRQIQHFFDEKSALYLGGLTHVPRIIAGHSYFSEANNTVLVNTRKKVADTAQRYKVDYWQSEYSMLGDGVREGIKEPRSGMDCALFLSKVIHTDLTVGNATAWQFWNAYEPGSAERNTRFYLIALKANPDFKDGEFTVTKNLWALGHYSRFVRPGMVRVLTETSVDASSADQNKALMISSYLDKKNQLVIVATNYGDKDLKVKLDVKNPKTKYKTLTRYLTTEAKEVNMQAAVLNDNTGVLLPARSISTIVMN